MTRSKNAALNAVFSSDVKAVRALKAELVDERDRDGRTALFQAVIDGETAIVALLIRRGADVNAKDSVGRTPLHAAAQEYRVATARALLRGCARVDEQDGNGNTPLNNAVFYSRGRGRMIRLLLAAGANRKLKNHYGVSPQSLARSIANYDVAKYFDAAPTRQR